MEGIIDKENERVRRFFALLDNMEKKVERLARDNRPPFNGERFLTDRELSGTLRISRRCLQDYRDQGRIPYIQLGGKILYRQSDIEKLLEENYRKYSINSLVYWVTYVHNVVYSFYRSMIYCYINSTQRCAGSIVIDIIPTNGADKRKFFPFAPYFPVTNVIKRYFYPYFPAIIGIKGYSFPYFPYLSGIMKIKTALYSLFSRLDWHKTVVFPCLGEIYEGIRSLSWEIPVT